ncbi:MAG: carboxypeptidase-like regulatory domain-containing protein [Cyclobacteriaceae bacterium]|nr:carboxypeptidase-like regulatory domain-containing protein [Cyclobacteriaceae bacterium]
MRIVAVWWLLVICITGYAQIRINGKIIDRDSRQPVPFASIGITGTAQGTSSNMEGEFSLLIPENASIKVSCVGYVTVIIDNPEQMKLIELTPYTIELQEIVVTGKSVNPSLVVRRAFASIRKNYTHESFLQRFFYRHYCKDDDRYGRLIEAFVDVWKHNGYRSFRKTGGDREEIRVTHLRRSLDNTVLAIGHPPISITNILQADLAGYQTNQSGQIKNFYTEASTLRMDFERYTFSYGGITRFEEDQVYVIAYQSLPDSILTTQGYVPTASVSGTLYITTDDYAFVKCEEIREEGSNRFRSVAFYKQYQNNYYPSHLVRESELLLADSSRHFVHIEMISTDISHDPKMQFTGKEPDKNELLNISYDSAFWNHASILKATPLEESIIRDLGGGTSLNRQFFRYIHYQWSTTNGYEEGEEKLNWLLSDSRGRKPVMVSLFPRNVESHLAEVEKLKQLHKQYRNDIQFILILIEPDENIWKQQVARFVLFADGMVNYRLAPQSKILRQWGVKSFPSFVSLDVSGNLIKVTGNFNDLEKILERN